MRRRISYSFYVIFIGVFLISGGRARVLGHVTPPANPGPTCGATDDTAAITAAIAAAGDQSVVIESGQRCTVGDIDIPNLRIESGGLLKPMTGHTIVISRRFEAGPYQTFVNAYPAQGKIVFTATTALREVLTEWWGAQANGKFDCTPAFNAALASLPNNKLGVNGGTIRLLTGDYHITGITITDLQAHLIGSGGPGVLGSTATSSTFISSTTNAPIIKYAHSLGEYSMRARLENLTVIGSPTAGKNQIGVWVDNNGILMRNAGIEKTGSHGLLLSRSCVGGYQDLEINSTGGDGINIDFTRSECTGVNCAGTHNNYFSRISIGGTVGDGVRIIHGVGNVFNLIDIENSVGDGAGAGAGIHVYYPGDGKLEPQNNMFQGVWNESNVVGDFIGSAAQNNYVSYVHYTSPAPTITGNNTYRNAADINSPAVDRSSYLLLGASETAVTKSIFPPRAPAVAVASGSGLTGTYTYKITFETEVGETNGGASSVSVRPVNQRIHLSGIPIGPAGTLRRNIYRTASEGTENTQRYVATLNDNTTTTYDDSLPDQSLGRRVPLYNASASRIVLDGEGNLARVASSGQTALIGPQISDPKWPSYGFQSRPGFGMYMADSNELSFVASSAPNPERQLRLLSTGVTDAMGGLTVGSGGVIRKFLSGVASVDFGSWSGNDCQERTISLPGAVDGDTVSPGLPNSLAAIPDVTWSAWVAGPDTVKLRGCKVTPGRSADPPAASVRVSVIQL